MMNKNNILSKKTGALYIRVSTDDQTEYSPDSQIKLCRKYAIEHDIEILEEHIYQEDGISGTKVDKRTAFKTMIAVAKKKPKPFDVILVYSFSRFARNREDSIMYKSLLRKKLGIEVISITQPLTEGKESVLMEALYEAMDEYYSLDLAENSIRGKIEKASRGEHQGNAPYGYTYNKNNRMIEIDKDKSEIVKLIFNEWIKPNSTIRQIVLKLNTMNIKTTRGCLWADRSLHIILRNPVYIGYTRFTIGGMKRDWHNPNTKVVKGKHEAIIDKKVWDLAQQKMEQHDSTWFKYKKPTPKHEHWLRGIVKCSSCGKSLVKVKIYNRPAYFQCTWYTKARCRYNHYIREDVLVPAILEQLKKDFTEKLDINVIESTNTDENNDIDIINKQLDRIKIKENRIKEAYINEIDTLKEYKENKKRLSEELELLNKELEKLNYNQKVEIRKEKAYRLCEESYKILSDSKVDEKIKSDISHKLFDSIIYNKEKNTIEITYK